MITLVDTSMLLAYSFSRDRNHPAALEAMRTMSRFTRIVPEPVLTELFYMTTIRGTYQQAIKLFATVRDAFEIASLTSVDMQRMEQIMAQYQDTQFDYTDTALMAISERLAVTKLYTFDRRDFSIFRPRHGDYLELLP